MYIKFDKLMAIYPLLLFGICVGGFPFCCNVFVSAFPFTLPLAPTENESKWVFDLLLTHTHTEKKIQFFLPLLLLVFIHRE